MRIGPARLLFTLAAVSSIWLPSVAFAQGALTNGDNHAGAISTPAEIDEWTFTASLGDAILLDIGEVLPGGADPDFRPWIRLRRPDGTEIGSSAGFLAAQIAVTAPLTGTYTVLVRDYTLSRPGTALGSYLLHFVKVPGTIIVPAGDQGGALTNGGNHAGSIHRGDLDPWTFSAAQDDAIVLSVGEVLDSEVDPDFRPWIRLYGPNGALLGSDAGFLAGTITVEAPLTGTYTVVVGDYTLSREGSAIGDYVLHLVKAPGTLIVPAGDEGGPMTNGANHAGRIGAQGGTPTLHRADLDAWTFTAAQNDAILLSVGEVLNSEIDPDFRPWIRLYGPNGALLGSSAGFLAGTIGVSAPLSGTYTVVVADYTLSREGTAVGDYLLHLVKVPGTPTVPDNDEGGTLTNGGNHAGRIGAQGATPTLHRADLDTWTFTAAQADAILVSVGEVLLSEIDPDFRPWIRLYGPNGALLGSNAGFLAATINVEAPLTGTYTVVVSDYTLSREGSAVGDYLLHLVKAPGTVIVPAGDEGGPLTNGGNHAGRIGAQGATPIAHRADLDPWTFVAAQNDAILLSVGEVLDSEIDPDFRPWIRLYGPDGNLLGSNAGFLAGTIAVAAPLTGTYTVVISDYTLSREGSAVGDYVLHFVKIPGAVTVPAGDQGGAMANNVPHAGRIGAPGAKPILQRGDLDVWTFSAAQNAALTVTIAEVNIPTPDPDFRPWIRLYNPIGTLLASSAGVLTTSINLNAPLTGIYTVVVSDYTLSREGSQVGDYTLTVNGAITPPPSPITVADSFSTARDTALVVGAPGVLGNDNANGGGTMTAVLDTTVTSGTLSLTSTGAFVYTPNAGFVGTVSFTYHAQTTGGGAGNVATVTITVTAGTPTPTTVADSYSTARNTSLVVNAPGVLSNDSANGGGALTAVLDTSVTSGTLSFTSGGSFVYTPVSDFVGTVSFTYHAQTTGGGAGNVATVTITVTPGTPTSNPDSYTLNAGDVLTVPAPGVLSNDTSNGGGALTAQLVSGPANGTLTLSPSGGFTYTPNASFVGSDSFTYRAASSVGPGSVATVALTVQPTGAQPPTELYVASIVGNTVTIRWTPPAFGPTPTGYELEGGIAPAAPLVTLATGSVTPIYTFQAPTGAFYIRLRTVAGALRSAAPSNEVRLFVNVPQPPSAPANLLGLVNQSTLGLAWRNTFGGAAPTGLILDVSGAVTLSMPLGLTDTFSFAGVPPGTYTLSLRAVNAGGSSPSSNAITLSFPGACSGPPLAPANFIASRVGNTINVMWDPAASGPAPTSYILNVSGSFTTSIPTPTRVLSGGVGPGSYNLSVVAVNVCGASPATAAQTVVVP